MADGKYDMRAERASIHSLENSDMSVFAILELREPAKAGPGGPDGQEFECYQCNAAVQLSGQKEHMLDMRVREKEVRTPGRMYIDGFG